MIICIVAASLMTLVGGMIFITINEKHPSTIALLTALSAGFLLSIIFVGIIPEASEMMEASLPSHQGWLLPLSVAGGAFLIVFFEKLLPVQHHHDLSPQEAVCHTRDRLFYITLIAFGLHSLFELISVLIAGASDMTVGILLALVIAIHNIPIGFIIVAQLDALGIAPRKTKKGMVALVVGQSALAILCYWLLSFIITEAIQGILLAVTAGVMLYLLFDELLPGIYREEDQHHINYAILAGALVMLLFLNLVGG